MLKSYLFLNVKDMKLIYHALGTHTCNEHAMVGIIHHRINLHVSWPSLTVMEDLQY